MPDAAAALDIEPPFEIHRPPPGAAATPLVFASPHSGRIYPADMRISAKLPGEAVRRSEDMLVDRLLETAPRQGIAVIAARYARAYIDVNRAPYELDAAMFSDALPEHARARTARVAAGLGSIARIVAEGQEIYDRKLTFAEAEARVQGVHRPYHAALAGLVEEARTHGGAVVLVDWHSMPAAATAGPGPAHGAQMVLGDRFGGSCAPRLTQAVERELQAMGYRTARNAPYAGGHTTEFYGRPTDGVHALQVEISRSLYLDEAGLKPTAGLQRLARDLERLFGVLARSDWSALTPGA
jgi:N-formylglutamate amidohydrolase